MPEENESVAPSESYDSLLIGWDTPEFINHPRGKRWFLVAGILTVALVVYGVLTQSATTAIVFLLLAGVYFLTHNQEPRMIEIRVSELGIRAGGQFYPYNTIKSFWMVYNPPFVRTLNLQTTQKGLAKVVIQLNDQDPVALRNVLTKKIPEMEGMQESFLETCIRLLRL